MDITRTDIGLFITIPTGKETLVDAWLTAISAIITVKYEPTPAYDPDVVPEAIAPAVYDIVARAIAQRLSDITPGSGRDPRVKSQTINGAAASYFDSAQSSSWFSSSDLADLGILFGVGTVTSLRTPAPDGVRFGNLSRPAYTDPFLDTGVII